MWQVPVGKYLGSSLTNVSRFKTSANIKQLKGITKEYLPEEWKVKDSNIKIQNLEFTVHKGVSVATIRK